MDFNNLKSFSPRRRQFFFIMLILITAPLITWFLLSVLVPLLTKLYPTTQQLISVLALSVTICGITIKIVFYLLDRDLKSKRSISLDVVTQGQKAIISCTVENSGRRRIKPQNIFLFIDQGIERNTLYEFPFLLVHEEGECDCNLSQRCKKGGLESYPEDLLSENFKGLYKVVKKLKHLSADSILFIDSGEKFTEDSIFVLKPGVYRTTAIWTAVKEDCICATKQFIIE